MSSSLVLECLRAVREKRNRPLDLDSRLTVLWLAGLLETQALPLQGSLQESDKPTGETRRTRQPNSKLASIFPTPLSCIRIENGTEIHYWLFPTAYSTRLLNGYKCATRSDLLDMATGSQIDGPEKLDVILLKKLSILLGRD